MGIERVAIAALMAAMAGGCSLAPEYPALKAAVRAGVDSAIEERKSFNDTKAKVAMELPCDMSLGAAMRLGDSRKRAILIELCGGPPADSQITVDDIAAVLDAVRGLP